jgi:hypothetical protein
MDATLTSLALLADFHRRYHFPSFSAPCCLLCEVHRIHRALAASGHGGTAGPSEPHRPAAGGDQARNTAGSGVLELLGEWGPPLSLPRLSLSACSAAAPAGPCPAAAPALTPWLVPCIRLARSVVAAEESGRRRAKAQARAPAKGNGTSAEATNEPDWHGRRRLLELALLTQLRTLVCRALDPAAALVPAPPAPLLPLAALCGCLHALTAAAGAALRVSSTQAAYTAADPPSPAHSPLPPPPPALACALSAFAFVRPAEPVGPLRLRRLPLPPELAPPGLDPGLRPPESPHPPPFASLRGDLTGLVACAACPRALEDKLAVACRLAAALEACDDALAAGGEPGSDESHAGGEALRAAAAGFVQTCRDVCGPIDGVPAVSNSPAVVPEAAPRLSACAAVLALARFVQFVRQAHGLTLDFRSASDDDNMEAEAKQRPRGGSGESDCSLSQPLTESHNSATDGFREAPLAAAPRKPRSRLDAAFASVISAVRCRSTLCSRPNISGSTAATAGQEVQATREVGAAKSGKAPKTEKLHAKQAAQDRRAPANASRKHVSFSISRGQAALSRKKQHRAVAPAATGAALLFSDLDGSEGGLELWPSVNIRRPHQKGFSFSLLSKGIRAKAHASTTEVNSHPLVPTSTDMVSSDSHDRQPAGDNTTTLQQDDPPWYAPDEPHSELHKSQTSTAALSPTPALTNTYGGVLAQIARHTLLSNYSQSSDHSPD